jgi:hypothetical protein
MAFVHTTIMQSGVPTFESGSFRLTESRLQSKKFNTQVRQTPLFLSVAGTYKTVSIVLENSSKVETHLIDLGNNYYEQAN